MKKLIALLISIVLIFSLAACSKTGGDDKDGPSGGDVEVTGIGTTAKITITEDKQGTGTMLNDAKLPSFSVDGESAAIDAINARIESEVVAFCNEAAAEPLQYAVADTAEVNTDRYLCAVVFYGRPLSVGMDHDTVASYVYDKATDSEVSIDDAFKIAGYDASSFDSLIKTLFNQKGLGDKLLESKVVGFNFLQNGMPEFFVSIRYDTGFDEIIELIKINPDTKSFDQTSYAQFVA
ncbi:MAG: hypothetical protein Q4F70_03805 [Clostridia bacterium]|nr:hypothetical protein [Clostridia bacterium]